MRRGQTPRRNTDLPAESRLGTWNVLSMREDGSAELVARELNKVNISITALSEVRWPGSGEHCAEGISYIYSGRGDGQHHQGVALALDRYTAEGIASDLQKTSSEVSIAYCTGSTEDLSTAQVHPLQDYWALTALIMSSRHEKLSELHLGAPGHYDLHFTSPKEHVIREVELARCCMVQYRRQLVHLQLMFAQCYAAFYNHMTGQERLEVESLVLLRAEVSREGEELQTLLGSHLQAVIEQDPAACVEDNPPSSMSKLQLLAQLIELLKEQGRMQQALALLVQNPAAQPGLHSPALPAPPLDTRQALHPLKQWELLAHDRERLQREVREIRQELCTEKEHRRRDMDKTLHRLRLSIMADVRQEIAEQMKLLRLQLQAKEEEVRMLRLQMRQQTKTRGDEGEGGSQTTRKSIRVTQL
ncbi:Hypp8472 [Branchiostoma lanceolatum]|uniref:Hypp8472 protein n=1 Tax=Branchiostoma lanceolatum TaxID=7740 RepID=A0A8J9Z7S2_BRALA|nr:Hypp8472 [Branchiostoma lanceolatum]